MMPTFYDLSEVEEILKRILSEDLPNGPLKICLSEESFKFFFVRLNRNIIYWSPDKLQEDMAKNLGNRNIPAKKTLRDLKENRPIFLGNIVTLDKTLRDYCRNDTAIHRDLVAQSGLDNGLPNTSVVSSLNILDKTRLVCNGYNALDYFMSRMGVSKKDIAHYLEKNCNSYNGKQLIDEIDQRCLNGKTNRNPGEARITTVAARGIWDFLMTKDRAQILRGMTWEDIFEFGPASGSGNGKWTNALLRNEGNII